MRIERHYSMEALAEILHDEELRNGREAVPPIKSISLTFYGEGSGSLQREGLQVVFDDEDEDD